ncbi:hypothetical protein DFO62_12645 [Serratia fonticola]|nr:hypothetical protein DFO62_12645 [Serratia fonticola]
MPIDVCSLTMRAMNIHASRESLYKYIVINLFD